MGCSAYLKDWCSEKAPLLLSLQATEIRTHKTQLFIPYFIVKMMTALAIEVLRENVFGKKIPKCCKCPLTVTQGKAFHGGNRAGLQKYFCVCLHNFVGFSVHRVKMGWKRSLWPRSPPVLLCTGTAPCCTGKESSWVWTTPWRFSPSKSLMMAESFPAMCCTTQRESRRAAPLWEYLVRG